MFVGGLRSIQEERRFWSPGWVPSPHKGRPAWPGDWEESQGPWSADRGAGSSGSGRFSQILAPASYQNSFIPHGCRHGLRGGLWPAFSPSAVHFCLGASLLPARNAAGEIQQVSALIWGLFTISKFQIHQILFIFGLGWGDGLARSRVLAGVGGLARLASCFNGVGGQAAATGRDCAGCALVAAGLGEQKMRRTAGSAGRGWVGLQLGSERVSDQPSRRTRSFLLVLKKKMLGGCRLLIRRFCQQIERLNYLPGEEIRRVQTAGLVCVQRRRKKKKQKQLILTLNFVPRITELLSIVRKKVFNQFLTAVREGNCRRLPARKWPVLQEEIRHRGRHQGEHHSGVRPGVERQLKRWLGDRPGSRKAVKQWNRWSLALVEVVHHPDRSLGDRRSVVLQEEARRTDQRHGDHCPTRWCCLNYARRWEYSIMGRRNITAEEVANVRSFFRYYQGSRRRTASETRTKEKKIESCPRGRSRAVSVDRISDSQKLKKLRQFQRDGAHPHGATEIGSASPASSTSSRFSAKPWNDLKRTGVTLKLRPDGNWKEKIAAAGVPSMSSSGSRASAVQTEYQRKLKKSLDEKISAGGCRHGSAEQAERAADELQVLLDEA